MHIALRPLSDWPRYAHYATVYDNAWLPLIPYTYTQYNRSIYLHCSEWLCQAQEVPGTACNGYAYIVTQYHIFSTMQAIPCLDDNIVEPLHTTQMCGSKPFLALPLLIPPIAYVYIEHIIALSLTPICLHAFSKFFRYIGLYSLCLWRYESYR